MSYSTKKIEAVEGFEGVFVRTLNALELADVADRVVDLDKRSNVEQVKVQAFVCMLACCDAEGAPLFTDEQAPLAESFDFVKAGMLATLKVNGLTDDDAGKA